jgi:uncharacterized protein
MLDIREHSDGVSFPVSVHPRSKKNAILGVHDGALKIAIAALPQEGAANEACRKFLSKILGISKSNIEIIKGWSSHRKIMRCRGINRAALDDLVSTVSQGENSAPEQLTSPH